MGGVPVTLGNLVSIKMSAIGSCIFTWLFRNKYFNSYRKSRPSLLSGCDSPSDLTTMFQIQAFYVH